MDIQIDSPIRISLDFMEFDEYVPSIKASVNLEVVKFNYCLSASANIWFEFCAFDEFVNSLNKKEFSTLMDVEMSFRLEVDFVGKNIS